MNYLAHHGIPNQKWGERNGPPYPLSREEHIKVVRSGDIKTIKENLDQFQDWEIEQAIRRFNYNQKISNLTREPETKKGKNRVQHYIKTMNTAGTVLKSTVNVAENSVRLYNIVAKTMNSLKGKNMKIIGDGHSGNDKKNDSKKN